MLREYIYQYTYLHIAKTGYLKIKLLTNHTILHTTVNAN